MDLDKKIIYSILGIGILIGFYSISDIPFIYNIRNKPIFVKTQGESPHQYYTFRSINGIGVCDSAHNMIIPAEYKQIVQDTFLNRYVARTSDYTTIFDADGQKILREKRIIPFNVNRTDFYYMTFDTFNRCGISDQFGEEIIPASYKFVKTIGYKTYYWFQAQNHSSMCIYDKAGNIVIPDEKFDSIFLQMPPVNTSSKKSSSTIPYWFIVKDDDKLGAYDISGNEIIPLANYTSIERPKTDHFILRNGEYVGIFKTDGNIIIQPDRFDSIRIHGTSPYYWYEVYQFEAKYHPHNRFCEHLGLCDRNGRLVIEPEYNDIKYDKYDDEFYTKKYSASNWKPTGIHLTNHPKPRPQSTQTSSSSSSSSSSTKKSTSNNNGNIEYSYPCALCNGTGTQYSIFGPMVCSFCGGTGVIKNTIHVDSSQMPDVSSTPAVPAPAPTYTIPSTSSSGSSSGNSGPTRVTKTETCTHCWGSGTCQQCLGRGWYYNSFTSNPIECSSCDHNHNGKCRWCHGTGTVTNSRWEY